MSTRTKNRKAPRYAQAAETLRERILRGDWLAGAQLPPERRLVDELGVSRITVRHALNILAEERLLLRRHGSGTYVAEPAARRIPLRIDYTMSMAAHAPGLRRYVLRRRRVPAFAEVAERLQVEPGSTVLAAERLDRLGVKPVAWDQVWIALRFARNLDRRVLARVDFAEAWSHAARVRITRCTQRIEAVRADPESALHLGMEPCAPVLRSTEIYENHHGEPAGLFVSWYHPEQICIDAAYEWPPRASSVAP